MDLPGKIIQVLRPFEGVFSKHVWEWAKVLLIGAILAPGERTVAAILRVRIDETIERRRGGKIAARGIYRDPVRSSKECCVKTSGLRWISLMVLTSIPWAKRVWALPFLTVLAPSQRYHEQHGKRHKTLTDWARQMFGNCIAGCRSGD